MKKIFVDTNILIDLLARREPFFQDASSLFSLADRKLCELSISALTFANTAYVLTKQLGLAKSKQVLRDVQLLVSILPIDAKIIGLALNDDSFVDFENALQYFTALEHGQDLLVTRNKKDYKHAQLPVLNAGEFVATVI